MSHLSRLLMPLLLALIIGVPLLLRPSAPEDAVAGTDRPRLVIVTPHTEAIRFEFERAFNAWRAAQNLSPVEFDWRTGGGTSDLRKSVLAEFTQKAQENREDEGIGYDLFFGGGDYDLGLIARGVTVKRAGKDIVIGTAVAPEVPAELWNAAFPLPDIGGAPLHHDKKLWVGVCLSSFGIVFNRDALAAAKLPEPTTWADLAHPNYRNDLALADPAHSGSIAVTYGTILRRMGWTQGWAMLRRSFANARYFTSSASKVPVDVSAGEAAAGMCIDFYGRFQAGQVGGDRVGYVDPPFMTAITADPILIFRGAPAQLQAKAQNKPFAEGLANQFVVWLLSPEAQGLWQKKLGTPGGPERFELRRLPIRRDLYVPQEMAHWTDPVDPFDIAKPFPPGMPRYGNVLLSSVAHALAIDIHDDLREAWRAIQSTPENDPRRAKMMELFDALPPELTETWPDPELEKKWVEIMAQKDHPQRAQVVQTLQGFVKQLDERLKDPDQLLQDRLNWTRFFQNNYRTIVKLASE